MNKAKEFVKRNGSKILIGAALFAAGAATAYICGNRIGCNRYYYEDLKTFKTALKNATGKIYTGLNVNATMADLGKIGEDLRGLFSDVDPEAPIEAMFIVTKSK